MNTVLHKLFDVVEAGGLTRPDFVEDSFTMLATAIAQLPPEERERCLLKIEAGDLRQAVAQFERPSYPKANGKGGGH
jgi:hypothetical protein